MKYLLSFIQIMFMLKFEFKFKMDEGSPETSEVKFWIGTTEILQGHKMLEGQEGF